jgi:activator of 2-hydroxyglutaryl-CoA dehydratase
MSYVGINIGALTVKVVAVHSDVKNAKVMAHQGRPLEVLEQLLAMPEFADAEYFGVSGHLGHISEFAAILRALREVGGEFDAVASLGGESFLVYTLAAGRVINVLSHNKCAAGSGEFLVQLIGRIGLDIDAAIQLSSSGTVVPLASRCTVHCKSDVTHKLNRHEATPADILKTLHDSMAGKVAALLEKGQNSLRRVLLIGGVTRNAALVEALRAKLFGTELIVLPESEWFEAWGSALLTRDKPLHKSPQISHPPVFRRSRRLIVIRTGCRSWPPPPRAGTARRGDSFGSGCGLDDYQGNSARSCDARPGGLALHADAR